MFNCAVDLPKFALLRSMFGLSRLTRLSALNASRRNSVFNFAVVWKRLESDRLTSAYPGPR